MHYISAAGIFLTLVVRFGPISNSALTKFSLALTVTTDRVEEVSHPLGDYQRENDGNAKRDVARTLDNDHRQTQSHPRSAAQVCRRANQHVLGYVRPLHINCIQVNQ